MITTMPQDEFRPAVVFARSAQLRHSEIDHRWGPRVGIDLEVRLIRPRGISWNCCVREISISGALVATRRLLPEMTRVNVLIPSAGGLARDTPLLTAYVARCCEAGLALSWMDLAPATVVELIARLTGPAGQRNTVQGAGAVY